MTSGRRLFLGTMPLLALGFTEFADSLHSASPLKVADEDALKFWLYGIGIPKEQISAAGAYTKAGAQASINREPIFLHYDENEKVLVPGDQISPKALLPSGDARVDFQLQRLRFNADDEHQFAKYQSGGIYMDMQQHPELASSSTEGGLIQVAASIFSAFFPKVKKAASESGKSGSSKSAKNKKQEDDQPSAPIAAGQAVALQQGGQSQTLSLKNGSGKAMFVAFVKDRRKSAFGEFIQAVVGSGTSSYSPLLAIPFMAAPALTAIRAIVANLQIDGGNQAVIMQSVPVNLAATVTAMGAAQDVLPVRSGSYIAVPQEHGSLIKSQLDKLKIVKGFLVPKDIDELDVNDDVVSKAVPGVSYLTLGVTVSKTTKGASCTG